MATTGCSSGDAPAAFDVPSATFTCDIVFPTDAGAGLRLTSTAFSECTTIPAAYTCVGGTDARQSPPLEWTAGPAGTMGYAVVLEDVTNGFTHWAIWDLPATTTELQADVPQTTHALVDPVGALQVGGNTESLGYIRPCPPSGPHRYVFTVYAQSALPLLNVTTSEFAGAVAVEIDKQSLAKDSLAAVVTR